MYIFHIRRFSTPSAVVCSLSIELLYPSIWFSMSFQTKKKHVCCGVVMRTYMWGLQVL